MATNDTWIVYKANSRSAEGWENRKLMPGGSLTNILSEEWDWSGKPLPQVGDRFSVFTNLADPGNGATHGKDADWVVTRISKFSGDDGLVVICWCDYAPVDAEWQKLQRGTPVNALLAETDEEREYWEAVEEARLQEMEPQS